MPPWGSDAMVAEGMLLCAHIAPASRAPHPCGLAADVDSGRPPLLLGEEASTAGGW